MAWRLLWLDRLDVDHIVKQLTRKEYGFRDLVELVVLSKAFQSK